MISQRQFCPRARSQSRGVIGGQEAEKQRKLEVTLQMRKLRPRLSLGSALTTKIRESELSPNGALSLHPLAWTSHPCPAHHHPLDPAKANRFLRVLLSLGSCLILHQPIGHLMAGPAIKGQGVQVAAFLLGAQRD